MFTKEMEIMRERVKALIDLAPVISTIEKQLDGNIRDLDMIADVTFLVRKCEENLDALKKRLGALEHKAAQYGHDVFPFLDEKKYTTENCTISDNSEFYVKFPSAPDKDGYSDFVKQLPPEAIRPHFPTVTELISKKLAEGDQIPYGLPKFGIVSVLPKLRMTSKKEL